MPVTLSADDHKRRARRRLIGAIALTITAVVLLPLVLEDEPPPAGFLEVRMPKATGPEPKPPHDTIKSAPPPANATVGEEKPEAALPVHTESTSRPPKPSKPVSAFPKPPAQAAGDAPKPAQASAVYTVQVGVFADKANVERLKARIAALGLTPYTEDAGGSTRVRVGAFASRAEADAVSARLKEAGLTARVVEK